MPESGIEVQKIEVLKDLKFKTSQIAFHPRLTLTSANRDCANAMDLDLKDAIIGKKLTSIKSIKLC